MKKKGGGDALVGIVLFVVIAIAVWLFFLGGWTVIERYLFTETIYVDASEEELVIDREGTSVILEVKGEDNVVSLSPLTRVLEIKTLGKRNVIEICDSEDPRLIDQGTDNEIVRKRC